MLFIKYAPATNFMVIRQRSEICPMPLSRKSGMGLRSVKSGVKTKLEDGNLALIAGNRIYMLYSKIN